MTVTTTLDRQYFDGDGNNKVFPFNFRFFTNDQIYVSLIAPDGTTTPQTLTTNYTLSGALQAGGGTVTMIVAPPLTIPATRVFVQRILPQVQPTSIRNQGKFYPEIHEDVFDRLTMLIQQALAGLGNALQLTASKIGWDFLGFKGINLGAPENPNDAATKNYVDTAEQSNISYTDTQILRTVRGGAGEVLTQLPPAAVRANKVSGFDASGQPIASLPASGSGTELALDLLDPSVGKGTDLINYRLRRLIEATVRKLGDKLDDNINFLDFLSPAQRADVASFAGTIDCTDAWDKMLLALKSPGSALYPVTPRIKLPMGAIYFATGKTVNQRIHIVGEGSGQSGGNYGTTIKFPAGVTGFTFIKGNTGPTTYGSDGSILEGLYVEGGGQNSTGLDRTKHGLDMQARIEVRDCTFTKFSGNGINIVAAFQNRKNANLWIINKVTLDANGANGLYVQGGDSNAGVATMVNSNNNNLSGIYDASFLGNTYIVCHVAGNGKKGQVWYDGKHYYCNSDTLGGSTVPGTNSAVWVYLEDSTSEVHIIYPPWVEGNEYGRGYCYQATNANARNVFLGCYSESSQPPMLIMKPSMAIGGIATGGGAGNALASTGTIITGGAITDMENRPRGGDYYVKFGAVEQKAALGLFATGDDPRGVTLQWLASSGVWVWKWANLDSSAICLMTTGISTETGGRSAPLGGGYMGFPKPFLLGSGTDGRRMFGKATWSGSGDPTSGEYARGEIYFHGSAGIAPGGKAGTLCTTAGTAGSTAVFRKFGAIDA